MKSIQVSRSAGRQVAVGPVLAEPGREAAAEIVERVALGRLVADVVGDEIVEERLAQRVGQGRELLAHAAGDPKEIAALVDGEALGAR